MKQTAEVECDAICDGAALLAVSISPGSELDKVGAPYDLAERVEAHGCQELAHLAGEEGEIVDEVFVAPDEMAAELGILCGYAHRAGVEVALAHHHAAQHDEHRRAESKLVSPQQCHEHHVACRLQLAVDLQTNTATQPVAHQRLLRFRQTYLGRDARKAH